MSDLRAEHETVFGQVCHAIAEYDKLVRDGGASGGWQAFLDAANDDPSGVCYEIAELHNELFPDYDAEEDNDFAVLNLSFSLGQKWLAFVTNGEV
jgi:hypothetical protein